MTELSLTVNGAQVSAEVEGRTLLVDFLRARGLTGTHVGCETSQCGACVVHMNGQPVKACSVFALEAEGHDITTIEGVSEPDGTLNTVQEAFRTHHGLQCGFCTPGMVMTTMALLQEVPKPTQAQVRAALEGNMCRCTGYHNIVKAVLAASGQDVSDMIAE